MKRKNEKTMTALEKWCVRHVSHTDIISKSLMEPYKLGALLLMAQSNAPL